MLESDRVRWHPVASHDELQHAWDVLVDLHQRRRRSLGEPGCFASRLFHDFHRDVVDRLLTRQQLRMSWLELDGVPAAAEYHFTDGTTTFAYQGGVDPERLSDEPGRLSTIRCLQRAIAEGHRQIDFMRGDEPYKAHWRGSAINVRLSRRAQPPVGSTSWASAAVERFRRRLDSSCSASATGVAEETTTTTF